MQELFERGDMPEAAYDTGQAAGQRCMTGVHSGLRRHPRCPSAPRGKGARPGRTLMPSALMVADARVPRAAGGAAYQEIAD